MTLSISSGHKALVEDYLLEDDAEDGTRTASSFGTARQSDVYN